jgi:flagellar biosynthesis protein FliR
MVVTEAQILAWLGHFLWPFLRITGMFLTAPFYGSSLIPAQMKAVLAAVLAAGLAFWLPDLPAFPADPWSAIYQGVVQIAFGASLGLVMQIVVTAVASAGEVVGQAMGLSFAELQFQQASSPTPVLYDIMSWVGLMGYLAAGGPIWLFAAIAHSFQAGVAVGGIGSWSALSAFGGTFVSSAVWLAMPVLAMSLCVNLTVGLTTVFAPQMNLLTIGFPLLILAGLWIFIGSVGYIDGDIRHMVALARDALAAMLTRG